MDPVLAAIEPVQRGSRGSAVANVHAVLTRLGLAGNIAPAEIAAQIVGPLTARAIHEMLHAAGLEDSPDGAIDAPTAIRVNDFLVDRRILAMVEGKVIDHAGAGAPGYTVRVYDSRNLNGAAASQTTVSERGSYRAYYDPHFYVDARPGVVNPTDAMVLVVVALAADGTPAGRSEETRNPGGRVRVDVVVEREVDPGPAPAAGLRVRGRVEDRNGNPLEGVEVEVYDRDIGERRQRLGSDDGPAITGHDGAFEIAYALDSFAEGDAAPPTADLIFVLRSGDGVVETFDCRREPVEDDPTIVVGFVVPRDELPLGIVARPDENVRLIVQDFERAPERSEYEDLNEALRPLLGETSPADLDEEKHRDISFAAREIGRDREKIADLVTASRMVRDIFGETDPAVLYGLARVADLRDVRAIALRSAKELAAALDSAVRRNVIPAMLEDLGELASTLLKQAAGAVLLQKPAENAVDLGSLIANDLPDADRRADLLTAYANHTGDMPSFWKSYGETNPTVPVASLQLTLQLGALTGDNGPLVQAIREGHAGVENIRALALHLDADKLADLIATSDAPLPAPREDETQKQTRERFARGLSGALDATQPTAAVARMARTWSAAAPAAVAPESASLLSALVLKTPFELGSGKLDQTMAAHARDLFDAAEGEAVRSAAFEGVKRIERLYQVSTSPAILTALSTGLTSQRKPWAGALDIARYSKDQFLASFPDATMTMRAELEAVHENASSATEAAASLVLGLHQAAFETLPAAISRPLEPDQIPTWAQVFGHERLCECDECRSLWGAPAYIVNVFEFLEKRCTANASGVTPLDILIGNSSKGVKGRRPDLAHIKLSCENANTPIPTIDLINEILESVIVHSSSLPPSPNDSSPGATADELAAAPENTLGQAYTTLAGAVYPIQLPFSRVAETARVYLAQTGAGREAVVREFRGDAAEAAAAAERLGLSARDWEILTGEKLDGSAAALPDAADLVGFTAGDAGWMDKLSFVPAASVALGVSVPELIAAASTTFVRGPWRAAAESRLDRFPLDVTTFKNLRDAGFAGIPADVAAVLEWVGISPADLENWATDNAALLARAIVLDPPADVSLDQTRVVHLDASDLAEEDWLRLHRLVRLKLRMKIDMADLDLALGAASAPGEIDAPALVALAGMCRIRERLGLDWAQTASLGAGIPTKGPQSLYARLFLRSGIARVDPVFALNEDGEALAAVPAAALSDHLQPLAVALRSTAADLAEAAKRRGITTLTLPNVSALHREAMLARALGISLRDLIDLQRIAGVDAFPAAFDPSAILKVMDLAAGIATAGVPLDVVAFFCGDSRGASAARSETALKGILASVRASVKAAQSPAAPGPQPTPRSTAIETLASSFSLGKSVVSALLEDDAVEAGSKAILRTAAGKPGIEPFETDGDAAVDAASLALLGVLDRMAALAGAFSLSASDLHALSTTLGILTPGVAALTPEKLFHTWQQVAQYAGLRSAPDPTALPAALAAIAAPDSPSWPALAAQAIAAWLKVKPADASARVAGLAAQRPDLRDDPVDALASLRPALDLCRKTGASAATLGTLAGDGNDVAAEDALNALIQGVQSRYDAASWLGLARQLNGPLREKRRDALAAYLMHANGYGTVERMYDALLVDPLTNSIVDTSRVAHMIACTQTFVQKIRLGQMVTAADPRLRIDPQQINPEWDSTLGSFRLWQANVKVFADPYVYMDESLRDDKTPEFKQFESFLRQNDVTPANVTLALANYMDGLAEIANLEVCGTFLQEDFDGDEAFRYTGVLHVIGRTRGGVQRTYYYRRLNRYAASEEWTPWERIKVDIQAVERDRPGGRSDDATGDRPEPGIHILPVVWRRRLHLFWPTLVRKVLVPSASPGINPRTGESNSTPPQPYWEIKLCWSRYENGAWTPRQMSSDYYETVDRMMYGFGSSGSKSVKVTGLQLGYFYVPRFPAANELMLKANLSNDQLSIDLMQHPNGKTAFRLAAFAFDDLRGEIQVLDVGGGSPGDSPAFASASRHFMGLRGSGDLTVIASPDDPAGQKILRAGSFQLTTLNQYYGKPLAAPFFFMDSSRTYFAAAEPSTTTIYKTIELTNESAVHHAGTSVAGSVLGTTASYAILGEQSNPWARARTTGFIKATAAITQSIPGKQSKYSVTLADALEDPFFKYLFRAVTVPTIRTTFTPFYHAFAEKFVWTSRRYGMDALFTEDAQKGIFKGDPAPLQPFRARYQPNPAMVSNPDLVETVDFSPGSPFGAHNNELFLHVWILAGGLFEQNHQFGEAMRALNRVIDPLHATSDPDGIWKFLPFRRDTSADLRTLLAALEAPASDPNRKALLAQIEASRLYPFQPFRIARLRPDAMKKFVFRRFVSLLIGAGDFHFRRYTPEDVTKAVSYYMIADALMGRKPDILPARANVPPKTYAELRPRLNELGNAVLSIESKLTALAGAAAPSSGIASQKSLLYTASTSYFCLPPNETMLALWDTIADRLDKIRNGRNIDGFQIRLPLYGAPLDPMAMVRAVAAGADLAAAAAALGGAQRPHHRFAFLAAKTAESIQTLISINASLLSTFEKKDAEHLAAMRAAHESEMLDFVALVKDQQVLEAARNVEALKAQRATTLVRWRHYREALGFNDLEEPKTDMATGTVTNNGQRAASREFKLVDGASVELSAIQLDPTANIEPPSLTFSLPAGKVLKEEAEEMLKSAEAAGAMAASSTMDALASIMSILPSIEGAVKPLGAGAAVHFGGIQLGTAATTAAKVSHAAGTVLSFLATNAGRQAGLVWKEREMALQLNAAASEALHIDQQLIAAMQQHEERKLERNNHDEQAKRTRAVQEFLESKFTSEDLYNTMKAGLLALQKQAWNAALDRLQMTGRAYQFDWLKEPPALPSDIWNTVPPGLLSGETLMLALRQFEYAHMSEQGRRLEVTRHFSLKQVNPFALMALRETGSCDFRLDESLFDIAAPGHYCRRLHSVQITMPSIASPYTPVHATLVLKKSWVRSQPGAAAALDELSLPPDTSVIVTSSVREDSGQFQAAIDERYGPFEGGGGVSEWHLSLPMDFPQFRTRTLSDVILTARYTALPGAVAPDANKLRRRLDELPMDAGRTGLHYMFTARNDFGDDWRRFETAAPGTKLTITISRDHLPLPFRKTAKAVVGESVAYWAPVDGAASPATVAGVTVAGPDKGPWTLTVDVPPAGVVAEDVYVFFKYGVA